MRVHRRHACLPVPRPRVRISFMDRPTGSTLVAHHLTSRYAVASEDAETDYFRVGLAENLDFTGWYLIFHGGPADPTVTLPDEDYLLHTECGAFTSED
jgi:hypothetical protein